MMVIEYEVRFKYSNSNTFDVSSSGNFLFRSIGQLVDIVFSYNRLFAELPGEILAGRRSPRRN
jgi:hypothetical protein